MNEDIKKSNDDMILTGIQVMEKEAVQESSLEQELAQVND